MKWACTCAGDGEVIEGSVLVCVGMYWCVLVVADLCCCVLSSLLAASLLSAMRWLLYGAQKQDLTPMAVL